MAYIAHLAGLILAASFRAGRSTRSLIPFRAVSRVAILTVGLLLSLGTALRAAPMTPEVLPRGGTPAAW